MRQFQLLTLFLLLGPVVCPSVRGDDSKPADAPTDNPVATFYSGPRGYPAWTDDIRWSRVINMKTYSEGKNDFEKFEKARNELRDSGGVLYYPAGTYDFTSKPSGKGMNLFRNIVIRGQAPSGKPLASDGKLELPTKFLFRFRKRGGQVPEDYNIIGVHAGESQGLKENANVGIAWVHLVGASVYFGPELSWAPTWATKGGWYSDIKREWKKRQPGGSHPGDVLVAASKKYIGAGKGRLVFGCALQDSAVLDDFLDPGYGPDGFHTQRHCARISVYGSRVLVANNFLPRSGKSFRYKQKTTAGNNSMVLFDYGKTLGIDVNKELLGHAADDGKCPGYYEEGVVVRDNFVFNHGHTGFSVAGSWVTVAGNRNDRSFLRAGDIVGPYVLTTDGYHVSRPTTDNGSRAFDLAGRNLWVDGNRSNNTGSFPGNDGESILGQADGGTPVYSWAITHNTHVRGTGAPGSIGVRDIDCHGLLIAWNQTTGSVGAQVVKKDTKLADCSFVANKSKNVVPDAKDIKRFEVRAPLTANPPGAPKPPGGVKTAVHDDVAVKVTWENGSDNAVGFRVERRIGEGKWYVIAYRPPRLQGDPDNPQAWVDFTAPPAQKLTYRVVAINAADNDNGASEPSATITLPKPGE